MTKNKFRNLKTLRRGLLMLFASVLCLTTATAQDNDQSGLLTNATMTNATVVLTNSDGEVITNGASVKVGDVLSVSVTPADGYYNSDGTTETKSGSITVTEDMLTENAAGTDVEPNYATAFEAGSGTWMLLSETDTYYTKTSGWKVELNSGDYDEKNITYTATSAGTLTFDYAVNNGSFVSGIAGYVYNYVFITACVNRGAVTATNGNDGAIAGYSKMNLSIKSSYNENSENSNLQAYVLTDGNDVANFQRCYNINNVEDDVATNFSAGALASGELCYNLNGGTTDLYWYQELGKDATPVLTASDDGTKTVYQTDITKIESDGTETASQTYYNKTDATTTELFCSDDASAFYIFDTDNEAGLTDVTGTNILVKGSDGTYTCSNAVLLDGTNYAVPYDYTAAKFTYDRELKTTDAGINTFVLPVEAPIEYIYGKVYKLNGYEDGVLKFEPVTTGTLEGNTPYLVQCTADADGNAPTLLASTLENDTVKAMTAGSVTAGEATHIGTYTLQSGDVTSDDNAYSGKTLYGYMDGAFIKATGTWTLNPFRTLITVPNESAVKALAIDLGGEVTGLNAALTGDASADVTPVDVYTLSGLKLRTATPRSEALRDLPAGVYIVGGQKVIKN